MADILDTILTTGKELLDTVKAKWKLSTLLDLITEKAIPAAIPEEQLEEFYAQRMQDLYRVMYDM